MQWLGLSYDAFPPTTVCEHVVFHVKCAWSAKNRAVVGQDNFTFSHVYTVNDSVHKIEPQTVVQRYFELVNDKINTCSSTQISYYPYPEIFFPFPSSHLPVLCLSVKPSHTHIISLSLSLSLPHTHTQTHTHVHTHWHTWTHHPNRINSLLSVLSILWPHLL